MTQLPIRLGLGLAMLSYIIFAMNAGHLVSTASLAALTVVWVVAGGAFAIMDWKKRPVPGVRSEPGTGLRHRVLYYLLPAYLAVVAVMNLLPALTPAVDWDGLAYHLALPKIYLQAHGFVFRPDIFHNLFPQFTEMLYQLGVILPTSSGSGAKVLHWGFGVLAAAAVWASLRELKLKPVFAWLGTAIFYSQFLVHVESGTAFIDLATTAYVALAGLGLIQWRKSGDAGWLYLSFLFLGISSATKWHGLILLALAWLLAVCVIFQESCKSANDSWKQALAAGFWGVAPVAPYLLRAYLTAGNPIWPLGFSLFGGRGWDAAIAERVTLFHQRFAGVESGWLGFLRLPYDLLAHGHRFGVGGEQLFFPLLGVLVLLAGVLIFLRPRWRLVGMVSGAGVVAFLALWFHSSPQVRFLLPLFPLAAAAAAGVISQLWPMGGAARIVAGAAVVLLLLVHPPVHRDTPYQLAAAVGKVNDHTFLAHYQLHFSAAAWLNQKVKANEVVLLFGENRGFYLDVPYLWGDPLMQKVVDYRQAATPDALRQRLAALNVRWVLYREDVYGPDVLNPASVQRMQAMLADHAERAGVFGPVAVYRLKE